MGVVDSLRSALLARHSLPLIGEGAAAPVFFLPDVDGTVHGLQAWNLLVFHGADGSYARRVAEGLSAWSDVGCLPYAIGRSRVGDLAIPDLLDEGTIARAYGAWSEVPVLSGLIGGRILPSVVLVNPARKVRLANRGTPSIDAILRSIQALQQGTRAKM